MTPWNQIGVNYITESSSVDGRDSADGTTESGWYELHWHRRVRSPVRQQHCGFIVVRMTTQESDWCDWQYRIQTALEWYHGARLVWSDTAQSAGLDDNPKSGWWARLRSRTGADGTAESQAGVGNTGGEPDTGAGGTVNSGRCGTHCRIRPVRMDDFAVCKFRGQAYFKNMKIISEVKRTFRFHVGTPIRQQGSLILSLATGQTLSAAFLLTLT